LPDNPSAFQTDCGCYRFARRFQSFRRVFAVIKKRNLAGKRRAPNGDKNFVPPVIKSFIYSLSKNLFVAVYFAVKKFRV
jgi:hypothetical protein